MTLQFLLTVASTLCTSFALLIVGGTVAPGLPFVGAIGTVIYSALSAHVVLLGGAGVLCALSALRLGGRRFVKALAAWTTVWRHRRHGTPPHATWLAPWPG